MIIKVKTLTGKEIAVELNNADPIYHIKELLEEKEGIPPSQQRLIFQGKQMYVAQLKAMSINFIFLLTYMLKLVTINKR